MCLALIVGLTNILAGNVAMAIPSRKQPPGCFKYSGLRPQLLLKATATHLAAVLLKATTPDRRQNMFDD